MEWRVRWITSSLLLAKNTLPSLITDHLMSIDTGKPTILKVILHFTCLFPSSAGGSKLLSCQLRLLMAKPAQTNTPALLFPPEMQRAHNPFMYYVQL